MTEPSTPDADDIDTTEDEEDGVPDVFARVCLFELWYSEPVELDHDAIIRELQSALPESCLMGADKKPDSIMLVHPDHPIVLEDATIPAQTLVANLDTPSERDWQEFLDQSWDWPDDRPDPAAFPHCVAVMEFMCGSLPHDERIMLLREVLRATTAVHPPGFIANMQTRHLLPPTTYTATNPDGDPDPFPGFMNVRFYTISGTEDFVMDTVGLGSFGLVDLQFHVTGLAPNDVANILWSTGYYLLEHGDVIEPGHTIAGLEPDSRWRCQHERAILGPDRLVLDVDPGPPYAAGGRHRDAK